MCDPDGWGDEQYARAEKLERELAAATKRMNAAEAVARDLNGYVNVDALRKCHGAYQETIGLYDTWQATIPAEEKETDESEICNHCDKTSPPHDLGVCAGCGDHYCDDHLNAHCQSCLM